MGTSYIGVNSVSGTTGSMACNVPNGSPQAGDIIIAWVGVYGTSTPVISNPGSGTLFSWNTVGTDLAPTANVTFRRAWKIFEPGESSYTFTSTNQGRFVVELTAYRGVSNLSPIHKENSAVASSGTTITVTTVTTTVPGCMGIALCGAYYTTTRTFSSESWATLGAITAEPIDTGNRTSGAVGYKQQAAAGATGDLTATISSTTSGWAGAMLMLAPGPVDYRISGAINPSAIQSMISRHLLDGTLTSVADLVTQYTKGLIQKGLSAGINFVGIETGKALKVLIGGFTSTGQIIKKSIGVIVSAFTSSADLIANKFGVPILKSLSAILSWKKKP